MADNVLTRKIGPLPTWGWVAVVGAGVVGVAVLERRSHGGGAQSAPAASDAVPPVIDQFQLSSPPEQQHITINSDDDDKDHPDKHRKHRRHRRHHKHKPKLHPGSKGPEVAGHGPRTRPGQSREGVS